MRDRSGELSEPFEMDKDGQMRTSSTRRAHTDQKYLPIDPRIFPRAATVAIRIWIVLPGLRCMASG